MSFKVIVATSFVLAVLMGQGCFGGKGFGGGSIGLINQLRSQLIVAHRQATLAAKTGNATIQSNIVTAQNSVDQELKASQKRVAAAKNPQCGAQYDASVSQVNSEDLKNYDQAAQLEAIDAQCALLAGMHAQISQVYILCPFWPASDQAKCIQDFSVGINTQITDSLDGILTAVADAVSTAAAEIEDASQNALDAISDAENAFNECVKSSP